jgi:hypothetical protein
MGDRFFEGMPIVPPRPSVNLTSPDLLRRIRAEYLEMPGLQLTALQAQCLFGLDRESCDAVHATLLETKFLARTPTGLFAMAASKG